MFSSAGHVNKTENNPAVAGIDAQLMASAGRNPKTSIADVVSTMPQERHRHPQQQRHRRDSIENPSAQTLHRRELYLRSHC
jgi:hypothetical protein